MTKMLIDGAAAESGPATTAHPSVLADAARRGVPVLDVVVPVYNEQARMRKGFALGRIPVAEVAAELRTGREQVVPPRGTLHQLAVFGAIGVVSPWLITAIGNTAANRRFNFGVRGQAGRARHHGEGLLVFGMALLITSGSLASVHALVHPTPHWLELGVLVTANLVATVLRFIALRSWVFHPSR